MRASPPGAKDTASHGPSVLPAFAEYSTEAVQIPGLVDTGPTIRAFLPFDSPEERSRVRRYNGKAVVWDARVACQKPRISNFKLQGDDIVPIATGSIRRTVSADIIQNPQPEAINFVCGLNLGLPTICQLSDSDIGTTGTHIETDDTSFLLYPSLGYGGGLKSEFGASGRQGRPGGAYLFLNSTDSIALEDYLKENPEWGVIGRIPRGGGPDFDEVITGTLCYTPLDVVDREVEISRIQPRAETVFASYNLGEDPNARIYDTSLPPARGFDTFEGSMPRLIPGNPRRKPEARGIFNLIPPKSGWSTIESNTTSSDGSWFSGLNLTDSHQLHFLMDALYLKYNDPGTEDTSSDALDNNPQVYGNFSVTFDESFVEFETGSETSSYLTTGRNWQRNLYYAVKDHPEGNIALALQAILTVIASNAYYDNLRKFNRREVVSVSNFQNVSSPGGPYGTRRGGEYALDQQGVFSTYVKGRIPVGFALVATATSLQLVIAIIILVRFVRETSLTRLSDPWQALAQVASEDIENIKTILELSRRIDIDRDAVDKKLKDLDAQNTPVGLEQHNGSAELIQREGRNPIGTV
ncbi:hypothetical protein ABW20_dc0107117 [Dactylellina cionopaga]|nr:hypothetical protein ABW20_dc0107117 [Dactylellina cionopaga]